MIKSGTKTMYRVIGTWKTMNTTEDEYDSLRDAEEQRDWLMKIDAICKIRLQTFEVMTRCIKDVVITK